MTLEIDDKIINMVDKMWPGRPAHITIADWASKKIEEYMCMLYEEADRLFKTQSIIPDKLSVTTSIKQIL